MKLLILTNNPSRPSFRQRIEIHLETMRNNGVYCQVAKLPSSEPARRSLFKRAANFDGVFLQKKCLNFFDAFYLRKYSKKIIYDFDDAIMYSPKRPSSDRSSHLRLFRRTAKLSDMIIAGNFYLAEHAKRFNDNVQLLPTGLDTKEYELGPCVSDDEKIRLVWIGSKTTLRYLKEIKPALEEIGSHFSNVVLRIICDEFIELEKMEVEKCRWFLEKQAADLTSGDIGLAPLPDNRFTRGKCGFKILQYQAAGLPVVASPIGTNSIYVRDNITGFLVTEVQEWTDRITQLIEDGQLRKKMGRQGRAHAERFDVSVIGKQLAELITKCLQEPVLSKQ